MCTPKTALQRAHALPLAPVLRRGQRQGKTEWRGAGKQACSYGQEKTTRAITLEHENATKRRR